MKAVESFMQPEDRGLGKRNGAPTGRRFTVQVGTRGAGAEAAVRFIVALGKRQKIGKRLGAAAVIKAERR